MNILQLCNYFDGPTNISCVIKNSSGYKVFDKFNLASVSLVSYDAFILTTDFFSRDNNKNDELFSELKKLNKPTIIVYDSDDKIEDVGMKFLSKEFKISFQSTDCSVLNTPEWDYEPSVSSGTALSMNSSECKGYCNVKNTKQYYILKKDNFIIMHDLCVYYDEYGQIEMYTMPNLVDFIMQAKEEPKDEKVGWLENVIILDDKELKQKLMESDKKIDDLLLEKNNLLKKMKENDSYKSILYSSGTALVNTIKVILEEVLNIKINDDDIKKEDLFFTMNEKNYLIEIKGVNHGFQRENISQAKRHVKDYAELQKIYGAEVNEKCKGILIINPFSKHDLKDKIQKDFYSNESIADAEYEKITTLDTLTLLNYYSKWKKDKKSIDFKKILLENNYNEPDFKEIIKL